MLDTDDKRWFGELLAANEARMTDRLELMETRLVAEFHRWAQTYEVRARGTSRAVAEFDERLGLVEERLARLERAKSA